MISDSFLKLSKVKENINPNYMAVAELIGDGKIIGKDTLIEEIEKTEYKSYYKYDGKQILVFDKNLDSILKVRDRKLNDVVKPILDTIKDKNKSIGAVCTGGTDSRTILACLKYNGESPKCVITGHKDNPDIAISHKI